MSSSTDVLRKFSIALHVADFFVLSVYFSFEDDEVCDGDDDEDNNEIAYVDDDNESEEDDDDGCINHKGDEDYCGDDDDEEKSDDDDFYLHLYSLFQCFFQKIIATIFSFSGYIITSFRVFVLPY